MLFFADVRLSRPDEHYYPLTVAFEAPNFLTAITILEAWRLGVEAASTMEVFTEGISMNKPRKRSYYDITGSSTLWAVIDRFQNPERYTLDERANPDAGASSSDRSRKKLVGQPSDPSASGQREDHDLGDD